MRNMIYRYVSIYIKYRSVFRCADFAKQRRMCKHMGAVFLSRLPVAGATTVAAGQSKLPVAGATTVVTGPRNSAVPLSVNAALPPDSSVRAAPLLWRENRCFYIHKIPGCLLRDKKGL